MMHASPEAPWIAATRSSRPVFPALAELLLLVLALSLPWELFQRIPVLEVTLTKVAGTGLILLWAADSLLNRTKPLSRFEVWYPVAALMALVSLSCLWSADRGATLSRTGVYASYLVLTGAIVYWVANQHTLQRITIAFLISSACVGGLAILCRAGVATPTFVVTTARLGSRVTPDKWYELTSRMVSASEDFNMGVLPLLVSAVLVLPTLTSSTRRKSVAGALLLMMLTAGIVISLSRSSLLVLVSAWALYVFLKMRQAHGGVGAKFLVVGFVLAAGAILLLGTGGFVERMRTGLVGRDASYEGRMAAMVAATNLLPDYWLWGTGLDASDKVIAASHHGSDVNGVTVHSVPFKLLLELGILSLPLYGWFWFSLIRSLWRKRSEGIYEAYLTASIAVFAVMLVQPFMALSLFPFLLGAVAGPMVSPRKPLPESKSQRAHRFGVRAAVAITAAVVIVDIIAFQTTAYSTHRFVEDISRGIEGETVGDFASAASAYKAAAVIADGGTVSLSSRRYYANAAIVHDLAYVERRMHVSERHCTPSALATLGIARLASADGNWEGAARAYGRVLDNDPGNALVLWEKARAQWSAGRVTEAIEGYAAAKAAESLPGNMEFGGRMSAIDARIQLLHGEASSVDARLEEGRLLRERGRWQEALAVYRSIHDEAPDSAEARFNLAVQLEVESNPSAAQEAYREILRIEPNHIAARMGLNRLEGSLPTASNIRTP